LVTNAVWFPGLCVDADDHAEGAEEHEQQEQGEREHERVLDGDAGDGRRDREQAGADQQRAHGAADVEREIDLPAAHRRRQDIVEVAIEAGLEDGRRVVGVRRLRHAHRDQARHDEHLVGHPGDLLDAPAQ
jgi:hypothetical protein